MDNFDLSPALVTGWLIWTGLRVVLITGLAVAAYELAKRTIPRIIAVTVSKSVPSQPAEEIAKRVDTLAHVLTKTVAVVIMIAALFTVLDQLGINIAPVLAGVGVAGIAVGFGAQSLVKDILNGLFIVLENQYGKGDVISIAGVAGLVEDINLRRTVLRDLDGTVHSIPNGEIRVVSNLTREWSRMNLNISVGYGEDLDRVIGVINRVGQELAKDDCFGPLITEPPQVLRVDGFEESGIAIKVLAVTRPIKQWDVAGEFRKRIKRAFDEEGIEIPFPHRVIVDRRSPTTGTKNSKEHRPMSRIRAYGTEHESRT